MNDIGNLASGRSVAQGVKNLLEQDITTLAAVKVDLSNNISHLEMLHTYFEKLHNLLAEHEKPAEKEAEAMEIVKELAEKLAGGTTSLEELGDMLNDVNEGIDTLNALVRSIGKD